jgi:hypothetical protein
VYSGLRCRRSRGSAARSRPDPADLYPRPDERIVRACRDAQLGACPVLRCQQVQAGVREAQGQAGLLGQQVRTVTCCLAQLGDRGVQVID